MSTTQDLFPDLDPDSVPAPVGAALLLMCGELAPDWEGRAKTVDEALACTGADAGETCEALGRLRQVLAEVSGAPAPVPPAEQNITVLKAICNYLVEHPSRTEEGIDDFQRFVLGLATPGQPGHGMCRAELAIVSGIPSRFRL